MFVSQIGRCVARSPDEHSCHVDDVSPRRAPSASMSVVVSKYASVTPSNRRQEPHLSLRCVTRSVAPTELSRSYTRCPKSYPSPSPASTLRQNSASQPAESSGSERPTASSAARWRAAKSTGSAAGAGVAAARAARVAHWRPTATTRRRGVFVFDASSGLHQFRHGTATASRRRIGRTRSIVKRIRRRARTARQANWAVIQQE